MLKFRFLELTVVSLFAAPSLWATPLKITTSSVTFIATGKPGFLKINGTGPDCHGTLDKEPKGITGEVSVPMEKFVTGIDLRDEHMKEKYFEVKKYPEAILKIIKFETDAKGEASDKAFKGTLNFHGIEKEIEGTATAKNDGGKTNIDANFPVTLSDFNISVPTYAGVKVADKVVVTAKIQAEAGASPVAAAAPLPAAAAAAVPAKDPKKAEGKPAAEEAKKSAGKK